VTARSRSRLVFWIGFVALVWLTHAAGYLVHEYAHSFTAWALGWKANPLALHYGSLNFNNLVFLDDIDENVNYAPILAAGKGWAVSLIAVAGVLIGNGLCYIASRWLYVSAKRQSRRTLALFAFLLCLMSVGNFLSYVPVRTFATHADMHTVEQGLGISPWWIAIVLGLPFAVALVHFLVRLLPDARGYLFSGQVTGQAILTALCCYAIFGFFGGAGMRRYGPVSHWISLTLLLCLPLALIALWPRRSGALVRSA